MAERRLHLDALRMLAIFFVVMNHTEYAGQLHYLQIPDQPVHWLLMALSALHKTAVPLFLMISGALLLDRKESYRVLFRRRVLRFALVLLLFSLLAYLYELRFDPARFNYYTFLTQLYSYRLADSYWYLYCYLGYLLALPLLRRLAAAMRDRDYQYLAALWLVIKSVELLPVFVLGESFERSETFMLFLLDYNVFFPLMGHYLEKRLDGRRFTVRGAALASLAALFSLALMCLATERWCRAQGQWPAYAGELTFGALNFVIALALFYIAKTAFLRRSVPAWAARTMTLFGSCSFGLYLLQHYFLRWLRPVYEAAQPRIGTYPACLLWVLCVCLAGSAATLLLKMIPGIKKLI